MVHALEQAHRVLAAGGHLIDLHPERGPRLRRRIPVIVRSDREIPAGSLTGRPDGYQDYLAADRAVLQVLRRGLFILESTEVFRLRDHLRSLATLERVLSTEWTDTALGPETRRRLRALLRRHPMAEIVVIESVRLNILRRL